MELINATRLVAGYTLGLEPSGRELLVIVVKGTFRLPPQGEAVALAEEQLPLVMADTFTGQPGFSATVHESDFVPRKHRCDVLLIGSAYAPDGRPTARVPVSLQIGEITKSFAVIGDRFWVSGANGVSASPPKLFTVMPVSYDRAFGGVDSRHEDPARHAAYMRNPVGRGFHKQLRSDLVDGTPLPNCEELDRAVTSPDGDFAPMAFGPVGRAWEPRFRYAGTYDQDWLDNHAPFLPPDFDEKYYQAAPADQQLPIPSGEQQVTLVNLTPDGRRSFTLPYFEAPVHVFPKREDREDLKAKLDTIVIEPDQQRFTMTWRVARPLKQSMFEIAQVLVGRPGSEWWQQRDQVGFPVLVAEAAADRRE